MGNNIGSSMQNSMEKLESGKTPFQDESFGQPADIRGKEVFDNPELCAQFLRDYSGIPLLKDVRPEDIEDVAERYHLFKEVEFNSDSVKRINMHGRLKLGIPLYIVSLTDHKSSVDYDVAMQFLRYMVCIWENWSKEMKQAEKGNRKNKSFRYPPVLPIVYYEGKKEWTADLHLKDRIMMADVFADYIPDFRYKLVQNHAYTNEDLLDMEDEMSLLMMLTKIQDSEDFEEFRNISSERLNRILENSSEEVLSLIADVVWNLCRKIQMPEAEAAKYICKVKERDMGYLFENMEKMNIQEERRKTEEQRERADEFERRWCEEKQRADKEREHAISSFVRFGKRCNQDKESIISEISKEFGLDALEAREKTEQLWEHESSL